MDHDCIQATTIALMKQQMDAEHELDHEYRTAMNHKVDTILDLLQGNGKPGLKADVEVLKSGRDLGRAIFISVICGSAVVAAGWLASIVYTSHTVVVR